MSRNARSSRPTWARPVSPPWSKGVKGTWRVDPSQLGHPFSGRAALLSPFDRLIHDRSRPRRGAGADEVTPSRRGPAKPEDSSVPEDRAGQEVSQASRSALIVGAWVVGMPCGKPW